MAIIRCPQCGNEFEKGNLEFCPNPNCGYPISFLDEGTPSEEPRPMERKPGEAVTTPIPTPPPPTPPPPKPPRNLRPILFVAGGIAVIAIILVAFLLLKGDGNGGTAEPTTAPSEQPTQQPSEEPSQEPSEEPSESPSPAQTTAPVPPAGIQLTWQAADPQTDLRGTGAQAINAMVGSSKENGQLVAGGSTESLGENDAAVWHSADGRTWTLVTGQDSLGGPGEQQINGISPIKGGGLIVVGSDTSSGSEDAAVWLSPDSNQWNKVSSSALGGPGKQSMNRVAATGTDVGILGVGSTTNTDDGTQDGAIWSSTDGGNSWTLLPAGDLGGPGDQEVLRVTVLRSGITTGFIAVGTSTLNGDSDAAVWTSVDGQEWVRAPDPDGILGGDGNQGMTDVQEFGDLLVAGGFDTGDGLDGAIWTSSNGTDWTQVTSDELGGAGDQVIKRILTTKPVEGLAVPAIVAAGTSTVDGDQDGALWYSDDGEAWNRETSSEAALGGQNAQSINTISQLRTGLVAVGSDASAGDDNAGVWTADAPPAEE